MSILEHLLIWGGVLGLGICAIGTLDHHFRAAQDLAVFASNTASFRAPSTLPVETSVVGLPIDSERAARVPSLVVPNTSLWSSQRRSQWLESLLGQPAVSLALLEIPSIDLAVMVLDGTDVWTLNRGVGRIRGTATVSSDGNLGLAGHRDGFFRALEGVEPGAIIRLTGIDGSLREYRIDWKQVVRPDDVWVLDRTERRSLTLVTCYPFRYVGSAPKRFVVRASEVERASGAQVAAQRADLGP